MLFGLVLQIIGNGGKEGTGTLQAALHITLHQVAKERDDVEGVVLGRQVHVRGKQGFNEPFTDLTVGIGQTIDLEITVIALNGQITALVEHRDGTRYLFRRRIKLLIGSLNTFQRTHIEVCMAQNIYQESRRARGEPIVLVFFGIESIEQAERVVNIRTSLTEMITVILPLQMQACLLVSLIISLGHPLNIGFQLRQQFLLGDAAEGTEVIAHTDILQIVQFAEDAQLAELADTRDKKKTEILPQPLERTEELAHLVAKLLLQKGIGITVKQRSIVLVNQHYNRLSGLGVGTQDDALQTLCRPLFLFLFP